MKDAVIQLQLIMYYNLCVMLIYQGGQKPLESCTINSIEIFNEFMICICMFHMCYFKQMSVNFQELSHYFGLSMIFCIMLMIFVNLFFVLKTQHRLISMMFIKHQVSKKLRCCIRNRASAVAPLILTIKEVEMEKVGKDKKVPEVLLTV